MQLGYLLLDQSTKGTLFWRLGDLIWRPVHPVLWLWSCDITVLGVVPCYVMLVWHLSYCRAWPGLHRPILVMTWVTHTRPGCDACLIQWSSIVVESVKAKKCCWWSLGSWRCPCEMSWDVQHPHQNGWWIKGRFIGNHGLTFCYMRLQLFSFVCICQHVFTSVQKCSHLFTCIFFKNKGNTCILFP